MSGDDSAFGSRRDRPRPRGSGGDHSIRDPKTGRPTPLTFTRDIGLGGDERMAAEEGPSRRSVSSSPRAAVPPPAPPPPSSGYPQDRGGYPSSGAGYAPSGYDGPPGGPPRPARPIPRPPRRRRPMRLFRTVLVLLLVVLVGYPLSLGIVAWMNVGRTDPLPAAADTPGTTYLLVGSDSRNDLTEEEVGRLNTGTADQAGGQRTDTILLLHAPGGSQPPVLISLPRDSFVDIPGRGQNKINAAYAFGGGPLLAETVTQATGVGIDAYVETGLGGFANITDAIGGVDICLPEPITDPEAGIDLTAGCQTLAGPDALGLARSRKTDARGDLARVERQRAILSAIVNQAITPATLLNPFQAYPLAAAGGSALTLDEGTGPIGLGRFVLGMRSVAADDGITMTVPVSNAALSTSAGLAVEWDPVASEQLWSALRANDMATVQALANEQQPALDAPLDPAAVAEQVGAP